MGGDEFVVVTDGEVSSGTLERLGRAIVAAMMPTTLPDGQTLRPQVSVGAALAGSDDTGDLAAAEGGPRSLQLQAGATRRVHGVP